ncbi:alpha/beta fold hydrolase [Herbiconiux solani]|uniref:alpha/beta fold hydrolase n=1 Tax=Herbiconiux solani TaxID=661329 RepID=UPI000824A97E|nr:alpha/beta hydrolase [Herbiconiux solani]
MPGFEERFTVVYFDTRHSGKSTGPEDAMQYTLQHYVGDIDAFREYLGLDRVFIAGHSAGGHQALGYGIAHDDRLLGIIAIDANVSLDDVRMGEMIRRINERRSRPFYQEHPTYIDDAMALMSGQGGGARPSIQEIIAASGAFYFHDPEFAEAAFGVMEFDDSVLAYAEASGFQSDDLLPQLGRITAPTLFVYGDDDFQCDPVSQGGRAHAALPGSRFEVIAEAGHMPWVEQPAAFAEVIRDWFERVQS